MRWMFGIGLFACCGIALADPSAGKIDPTFGDADPDGITEVGFNFGDDWNDWGAALAEDAQGRLVMAGVSELDNGKCLGLMRFSADGVLDKTAFGFNPNQVAKGKICHPNPVGDAFPLRSNKDVELSIGFQPDGRMLIAGWAESAPFICRVEDDGRLDGTFGLPETPGCRRIPQVQSGTSRAPAVLLRENSILLVANDDGVGPVVVRMSLENGSFMSYGNQTFVPVLGEDAPASYVWAVALAPDGGVIAVGGAMQGDNVDFFVARFDSDTGEPDTGFAQKGWTMFSFDSVLNGEDYATAVNVTDSGALLVAGPVENSKGYQLGLVQLDASSGEMGQGFNGGKLLNYDPCEATPDGCYFYVNFVGRALDDKIVIAGDSNDFNGSALVRMFAARLNPDLTPDSTFGPSTGLVQTGTFGWSQGPNAGAVLQGNRVVLGGWRVESFSDDSDFALLRLSGGDLFGDGFEKLP